jgi:hypothetical protein
MNEASRGSVKKSESIVNPTLNNLSYGHLNLNLKTAGFLPANKQQETKFDP